MDVPRIWRLQRERYTLRQEVLERVPTPAGPMGERAELARPEWPWFSGVGQVESYTTIYDSPAGFEFAAPYIVALVQLDDGRRVTAQLTDIDTADVQIGLPVEMVTRKLRTDGPEGVIVYGYKFRPIVA